MAKVRKTIRIKQTHREFLESEDIELSSVVRERLRKAMSGQRKFSTSNGKRQGMDLVKRCLTITPAQEKFIQDAGMNFTWFVEGVIRELINEGT